jgi:hydroxymethylglutaryl-CoA reductase
MVIEESSVVAAASKSAKFWSERGGFKAEMVSSEKVGQVHFLWKSELPSTKLFSFFEKIRPQLLEGIHPLADNMEKRGGGVTGLELLDKSHLEPHYFQIFATFETCDAMGANFINSILEKIGRDFLVLAESENDLSGGSSCFQIIMSILSNYTPHCLVRARAECPVEDLDFAGGIYSPREFAERIAMATRIAHVDPYRATTHNKGIFNGIDAVGLSTGNDFRAIEACGHAYAARDGQYRGLTKAWIDENDQFIFSIEIPLALGTVGGLTSLHPLAQVSLSLLGNPSAAELSMIAVCCGLAQNFGALSSLVTTGIQKGHMKMHLLNILNQLGASEAERESAKEFFADRTISYSEVKTHLQFLRKLN